MQLNQLWILSSLLLLGACSTTRPTMHPIVKPTNAAWITVATARQKVLQAQQNQADKGQALRDAEYSKAQLLSRQAALNSILSSPDIGNISNKKDAKLLSLQTFRTAADSEVRMANERQSTSQKEFNDAEKTVEATKLELAEANARLDDITRGDFDKQYANVISECQKVLDGYRSRARTGSQVAFWIQISGLLAGAVASPALVAVSSVGNRAWIAGLSGYAGGTNLAETTLGSSNLNGVSDANTANQLATKISTDIAAAVSKTSWDEKYDALSNVVADCSAFQIGVPSAPTPIPEQPKP